MSCMDDRAQTWKAQAAFRDGEQGPLADCSAVGSVEVREGLPEEVHGSVECGLVEAESLGEDRSTRRRAEEVDELRPET